MTRGEQKDSAIISACAGALTRGKWDVFFDVPDGRTRWRLVALNGDALLVAEPVRNNWRVKIDKLQRARMFADYIALAVEDLAAAATLESRMAATNLRYGRISVLTGAYPAGSAILYTGNAMRWPPQREYMLEKLKGIHDRRKHA